jgi:anti-anti-sigma regulatory factor
MKIITHRRDHSKIEIVEISNGLTGREALDLEEFLYTCLDEGNHYILINLENIKKIDGLGFHILEYFLKRGIQIRIFNVEIDIQTMMDLSGKRNIIKPYNETDTDKALSLFEKEILKIKDKASLGVTGRRHTRINTSFAKEFKYHSSSNEEIEGKASILNLSEGGLFANRIRTFNLNTGKTLDEPQIAGRELHYIKFSLNGTSKLIEAKGRCIWQTRKNTRICVGIQFRNLGKVYKDRITEYKELLKIIGNY